MTVQVAVHAHGQGYFSVRLGGSDLDIASLSRAIQPHASPQIGLADPGIFLVPAPRLLSVFAALAALGRAVPIELDLDQPAEAALQTLHADTATLRAAMAQQVKPAVFELPGNFRRILTPEQADDVASLLALPHGANFSVPGAGKTTVTLALYSVLKSRGVVSRLVVVCPRNAFLPWEEEVLACFTDAPLVARLTGGAFRVKAMLQQDLAEISLVSYSQVAYCQGDLERFMYQHPDVHLVLDESHRIKRGVAGIWASAVQSLAPLARRRDILSGTPLPNGPVDLSAQLRFLWPYQTIISESDLASAPTDLVSRRLRPMYVRITKNELDLPKQRITKTAVAMGRYQRELYDFVRSSTAASRTVDLADRVTLTQMRHNVTRLLQITSNPSLIAHQVDEFDLPPLDVDADKSLGEIFRNYARHETPPKFLAVYERVKARAAEGKKTIVWSIFVRNLRMLSQLLQDFGPVVLHGGIPTSLEGGEPEEGTREAVIHRFKTSNESLVLVANPAACGESISLHTVCDYAIYLDRNFNAGQLLQSMDRIHRLGLAKDRETTYEFLISPDSIDEVVDTRLNAKNRDLFAVLADKELEQLWLDVDSADADAEFDQKDAQATLEHILESRR